MRYGLLSVLGMFLLSTSAFAQAEISVTAGMQSCSKHADCGLVATSCLQACSFTPINKLAMSNINARYRDYCGFEAGERPACNITPPLEATCVNNLCTLAQARTYGGFGNAYNDIAPATGQPTQPVPRSYRTRGEKSGNFTAYDLPQDIVKQNIMGQYRISDQ
ncbi:MAG: hypothetical protein AAF569_00405 [Pseudomonadota bacterium]